MSGAQGAAGRVLVVDDDPGIRDLTRMALESAGYQVATAKSGTEGLSRACSEPFDLVLLDINMPEMDGLETLRLIRLHATASRLPVLMFSVKSELRHRIAGMQEGAVDYIVKPFAVDDLIARVRRVLALPVSS